MRVLVNEISSWDGAKTGVGYYTSGLVAALDARGDVEVAHYPPTWLGLTLAGWKRGRRAARDSGNPKSQLLIGESSVVGGQKKQSNSNHSPLTIHDSRVRISDLGIREAAPPPSLKHRLLQRHFQRFCRHGRFDLYHEPNFIPFACDLPTVVTIHDLSVLLHPEWHPAERVRHYELKFQRGLAACTHILTVSEFTRREVIAALGQPPERVTRAYNGVRPSMMPLAAGAVRRTLRQLGMPPRYLLHVGTIEPRKNLLMLVRAYGALPAALRESCPLVLAGGWGWNHEEIARLLESDGRRLGVLHVGYLRESDLPAVYAGAQALVFPSFYEGFGLPVLEMMACGGAVLASTADVLVELVAGQAHLIDPRDADGWREAMTRVITDAEWRQTLRSGAVQRAARFTWEACAADTEKVYRTVSQHVHPRAEAG
jgi:glycosyltransferase involved in cell wall biosynthesis